MGERYRVVSLGVPGAHAPIARYSSRSPMQIAEAGAVLTGVVSCGILGGILGRYPAVSSGIRGIRGPSRAPPSQKQHESLRQALNEKGIRVGEANAL